MSADPPPARPMDSPFLGGTTALLVLAAALWVVVKTADPTAYNHDVAWTLHAAETLRRGGGIPDALFDTNPPLVYWLFVPVVALARGLGVSSIGVANAVVLGLVLASVGTVGATLRWLGGWRLGETLGVASIVLVAAGPLADYDFGQRDHLVLVLLLPYVVAAAHAAAGRHGPSVLRGCTALGAALAIALKPHYGVVWLAIEGVVAWRRREAPWRRFENATIVGAGAAYLVAVVLFAPGWFDAMGITIRFYGAYSGHFTWLDRPLLLLVGVTVVTTWLARSSRWEGIPDSRKRTIELLLVSAWLAFGVAALQNMGFSYHLLPTFTLTLVLYGVVVLTLLEEASSTLLVAIPGALLALVLVGTLDHARPRTEADDLDGRLGLAEVLRAHPEPGGVLVLATSVFPTFPAVNLADRRSVSRFSCQWLVPGLLNAEDDRGLALAEAYVRNALLVDLQPPPALLVEDRREFKQAIPEPDFDLLAYFLEDPRFARFFEGYEPLGDVGDYRVYRRR